MRLAAVKRDCQYETLDSNGALQRNAGRGRVWLWADPKNIAIRQPVAAKWLSVSLVRWTRKRGYSLPLTGWHWPQCGIGEMPTNPKIRSAIAALVQAIPSFKVKDIPIYLKWLDKGFDTKHLDALP
jgi:hypothetical protein